MYLRIDAKHTEEDKTNKLFQPRNSTGTVSLVERCQQALEWWEKVIHRTPWLFKDPRSSKSSDYQSEKARP